MDDLLNNLPSLGVEPVSGIYGGERLHGTMRSWLPLKTNQPKLILVRTDIIRQWQATHLYDKYKLTQLHIFRDTVSKSFDHQVLAT